MKRLYLVLFCILAFPLMASHIVGGEFELIHVTGNTYRLNLILYFDKVNGSPGAKDNAPVASIYRKSDGGFMRDITLLLSEESPVLYTQPECSNDGLQTDRIYYTTLITLSPDTYNDPQGYYVVWQRCCRNYTISNIVSQPPPPDNPNFPDAAGQTFYLEFPPVVKDDEEFRNSSPHLFPPLSDYGCPGRQYYVDFAGVDDDGDSLVYSMTTPFNTKTSEAFPPSSPAPYPEIKWQNGFGINSIMKGSPELKISKDGLLTVTPTLVGLFVFAVKVEEYRDKVKIGETRRDFQMLVTDGCPHADPPQIEGKKLADANYVYDENMSVSFSSSVSDEERCIMVRVSDPDASKAEDNFIERVSIRVVPLNFKSAEVSKILPAKKTATLLNGNTVEFRICFPQCPYFEGGPYQVGIIAYDDACSLPLLDTLKVAVDVEPPPNERVKFVTPVNDEVIAQLNEGDEVTWPFEAHDPDGDDIFFYYLTNGFLIDQAGMAVNVESNESGSGVLKGTLSWDAFCDIYDFNHRTSFEVTLMADDNDVCGFNEPDTAIYKLNVVLPGNADPVVDTDLTPELQEKEVKGLEKKINSDWSFNVTAKDETDNDFLALRMIGKDFNPSDYGMSFEKKTGNGFLSSPYEWKIRCDNINLVEKDLFEIQFLAVDSTNKCRIRKADTVTVEVKILPPDNSKPRLTIENQNPEITFSDNSTEIYLGEPISLKLTGSDEDVFPEKDNLILELLEADGNVEPDGYSFEKVTGPSEIQTSFTWSPDCSIFREGIYQNNYTFTFRVTDDRCHSRLADTVYINIKIRDVENSSFEIEPPNVFTPNDDGFNDYYAMEKLMDGKLINILPPDNCIGSFINVKIYNRWGKAVFESSDRNFKWFGENAAAGVYYYCVRYTNREYKGTVSLRN